MYFIVEPTPYNHNSTENFCSLLYRNGVNEEGFVKNLDGSLSLFVLNSNGIKSPQQISKTCCDYFRAASGENYIFDLNRQTCNWASGSTSTSLICEADAPLKVVLNPKGNDGSLFFSDDDDDTCSLLIDFDYLFKFDCKTLSDLVTMPPKTINQTIAEIQNIQTQINEKLVTCNGLNTQYTQKLNEYANTPYSVTCTEFTPSISQSESDVLFGQNEFLFRPSYNPFLFRPSARQSIRNLNMTAFGQTGFGSRSPYVGNPANPMFQNLGSTTTKLYCINGEDGLAYWKTLLDAIGPNNYQRYLDCDPTSYTCANVARLIEANNGRYASVCSTPFGTKCKVEAEVNALRLLVDACNAEITALQNQIVTIENELNDTLEICKTPVGVFENLEVWANLEVITTSGTIETVTSERIFDRIGVGKLYDYLRSKKNLSSGFYVCGNPQPNETWTTGCTPLNLVAPSDTPYVNTSYCKSVNDNILAALFVESGFEEDVLFDEFIDTLDMFSFNSEWLHYSRIITDSEIIDKIRNKKIKISLTFSSSCSDVAVLIDQIKLDKVCTNTETRITVISESPGFNLERVIDNKKSWVDNNSMVDRDFVILNALGTDSIRRTEYDSLDERLMINSKEIDLAIDIAKAIETDVWCYISDNPCLLTGTTALNPCMSCNTTTIDIDALLTTEVSGITTIEGFQNTMLSELIDVKNRKVIQSYPTLKALYERYLNSSAYCSTNSSEFNYYSMEDFVNLLGTYWVDLIEQVVPSTTIWESVKIYTNTLFDQQKFRYKSYRLFYGSNPFVGYTVSSPINGTSGLCSNVEVHTTTIVAPLKKVANTRRFAESSFGGSDIPLNIIISGTTSSVVQNTNANSLAGFVPTGPNSFTPISSEVTTYINSPIPSRYSSVCIAQMNTGSEFIGSVKLDPGTTGFGNSQNPYGWITNIGEFNPNVNNLITE